MPVCCLSDLILIFFCPRTGNLSFLACSIDLQRNENDQEPEIERLVHIEKDPGDR
jgi:hypothetical protein